MPIPWMISMINMYTSLDKNNENLLVDINPSIFWLFDVIKNNHDQINWSFNLAHNV